MLILPWSKVGYGTKATANVRCLPPNICSEDLGRHVREQAVFCDESFGDPRVINPLLSTTGLRSMRAFINRWNSVVIYFDDQIRVSPTSREAKGAYWELFKETVSLPWDASDLALGEQIREAFSACRWGRRDY
jgi:hypothetical protein